MCNIIKKVFVIVKSRLIGKKEIVSNCELLLSAKQEDVFKALRKTTKKRKCWLGKTNHAFGK